MRPSRLAPTFALLTASALSHAAPPEAAVQTTPQQLKDETAPPSNEPAAVVIEPTAEVIRKAHAALRDERHRDATELLTRAIASAPSDPDLQNELGVALFQQRAYKAAALAFAKATRLRPESPNPWMNLATALRLSGEAKRAAAAYHTYLQIRPMDVHAIYGLALAFLDFADYDKAEQTLRVAERLCDDDDVTEGLPGGIDAAEALLPRIATARERIALERTELGKPVAERAEARSRRGDLQGALVLYDQAVAEAPKDLDLLVKRGRTRAAMQDTEGARMDYESALAIDPRHPEALAAMKALGQPLEPTPR